MTFEDLLDQAIAMLQRRGRVTYRTLKRQFALDDDALEDLKEELIYGQRLAVDEDGRVLVWMEDASTAESVTAPPQQQEGPQASLTAEPRPADAERRQLTVLFCDLVDSTVLASQLDEGLRALEEALAAVQHNEEGHYEAEVYRLKGELLLQKASAYQEAAEEQFQQALAVARRRQAKSWELRAAVSLSRLWQRQEKGAAARQLLAPIYGWFTEGFDTADLQEAKALLEAL